MVMIQAPMKKLSYSISTAMLRRWTTLHANKHNAIRWSLAYEMVGRNCELIPFSSQVGHEDLSELHLEADEDEDVKLVLNLLSDLDSVIL